MVKQGSLRYDPNSCAVKASILPHMAGISCKKLISRTPSTSLHLPSSTLPSANISLSAKVAAMFGLLEANLDFAASTWRANAASLAVVISASNPRDSCHLWGFVSFSCGSKFVVWCCVGVIWKMRDETADCTAHRYFDFSEELTEEKQDKNTALDKTQTHKQWRGWEGKWRNESSLNQPIPSLFLPPHVPDLTKTV